MSKAVFISIRPKWCEKIINGDKTIEVRKTRPKLKTPFRCYIYCTRDKHLAFMQNQTGTNLIACMDVDAAIPVGGAIGNGKVIGEFTCDRIYEIRKRGIPENFDYCYLSLSGWGNDDIEVEIKAISASCVSKEELNTYGTKAPFLYGWHITDLRIYDTPRDLGEFSPPLENCIGKVCDEFGCASCENGGHIKRPPQSWCYVDDLQTK